MTVLSDLDIVYENGFGMSINPFSPTQVQPASYDVTLSNRFIRFRTDCSVVKAADSESREKSILGMFEVPPDSGFRLLPQEFALASTVEYFQFSNRMAGRLEGKSSLGRLGLCIHATAGWFDPGFEGTATIELFNMAPYAIDLTPGMLIAQMSFLRMSSSVKLPYGSEALDSKYQGQVDPEASRYRNVR